MTSLDELQFAVSKISDRAAREIIKKINTITLFAGMPAREKILAIARSCDHAFIYSKVKNAKKEKYRQLHLFDD